MPWYDKYVDKHAHIPIGAIPGSGSDYIIWHDDNGLMHRDHGPAKIFQSGKKLWVRHGILHRLYAPAEMYKPINGVCLHDINYWWINGKNITKKVESWIKENNYPDYTHWDNSIRVHFKLTFVG